jgi:hypothetical protein
MIDAIAKIVVESKLVCWRSSYKKMIKYREYMAQVTAFYAIMEKMNLQGGGLICDAGPEGERRIFGK